MSYGIGGDASIDEHPEGEWVKFKDYEKPKLPDEKPKLPDGYSTEKTEDDDWRFCDLLHEGKLVASIDLNANELNAVETEQEHFPAIAAFLKGAR
jgi:hypothetical protein